jgi:hypothetical protein
MIDVQGVKLETPALAKPRQHIQEHDRVDAAAQSEEQAVPPFEYSPEACGDLSRDIGGAVTWSRLP